MTTRRWKCFRERRLQTRRTSLELHSYPTSVRPNPLRGNCSPPLCVVGLANGNCSRTALNISGTNTAQTQRKTQHKHSTNTAQLGGLDHKLRQLRPPRPQMHQFSSASCRQLPKLWSWLSKLPKFVVQTVQLCCVCAVLVLCLCCILCCMCAVFVLCLCCVCVRYSRPYGSCRRHLQYLSHNACPRSPFDKLIQPR